MISAEKTANADLATINGWLTKWFPKNETLTTLIANINIATIEFSDKSCSLYFKTLDGLKVRLSNHFAPAAYCRHYRNFFGVDYYEHHGVSDYDFVSLDIKDDNTKQIIDTIAYEINHIARTIKVSGNAEYNQYALGKSNQLLAFSDGDQEQFRAIVGDVYDDSTVVNSVQYCSNEAANRYAQVLFPNGTTGLLRTDGIGFAKNENVKLEECFYADEFFASKKDKKAAMCGKQKVTVLQDQFSLNQNGVRLANGAWLPIATVTNAGAKRIADCQAFLAKQYEIAQ